jgi:hypothetical protein
MEVYVERREVRVGVTRGRSCYLGKRLRRKDGRLDKTWDGNSHVGDVKIFLGYGAVVGGGDEGISWIEKGVEGYRATFRSTEEAPRGAGAVLHSTHVLENFRRMPLPDNRPEGFECTIRRMRSFSLYRQHVSRYPDRASCCLVTLSCFLDQQ